MSLLHTVVPKNTPFYDFSKHVHLGNVFQLSDGSEPQGYVVIYDRMNCKNTVTFAEVVVTYNPLKLKDYVVLGFGDYNGASSDEDISDEIRTVRYSSLSIECESAKDALEEGEYLAGLLEKSFMDAYEYITEMLYED